MRFRITAPCLVGPDVPARYIQASVYAPVIHELPDDVSLDHVSRTWAPMDTAAQAALGRLGVTTPLHVDQVEPVAAAGEGRPA